MIKLTPTARRHLETARDKNDGELNWSHQANLGGSLLRMRQRLEAAGLVRFYPERMAYCITERCRELLEDLPPIKRRPSYRAGGRVHPL